MINARGLAKNLIFIICVVLLSITLIFSTSDKIADAVLPENYKTEVLDKDLDWQNGENFLNLEALIQTVSDWKTSSDYDFSKLENNPIIIAVIDTGCNFGHEIFQGDYDENGVAIGDSNDVGEYDVFLRDASGDLVFRNTCTKFGHDDETIEDTSSQHHGTHVCGIIATLIHELDLEDYVKILPIKSSFNSGGKARFLESDINRAIKMAINLGADVINLSLGDMDNSWEDVVPEDAHENAVIVAAAGNSENGVDSFYHKFYPAACSNVIGVMNYKNTITGNKILHNTSNFGEAYDICAPGYTIMSANGALNFGEASDEGETSDENPEPQYYVPLTGTSMASPMVAFASGLLELKYRAINDLNGKEVLPDYISNMIKAHSSDTIAKSSYQLKCLDLNSLITTPFLTSSEYEDVFSVDPTEIEISVDDNSIQYYGDTHTVNYTANILPENAKQDLKIVWYKVFEKEETKIGEGKELAFTPEIIDDKIVGTYTIKAKIEGYEIENRRFLEVQYQQLQTEDAKLIISKDVSKNKKIAIGEDITFTVENIEFVNPKLYTIYWFVNEKLEYVGNTFVFNKVKEGEYKVRAKLNGVEIGEEVVLNTTESLPYDFVKVHSPLELGMMISMPILGVILLGIIIIIAIKFRKYKVYSSNSEIDDDDEDNDAYAEDYENSEDDSAFIESLNKECDIEQLEQNFENEENLKRETLAKSEAASDETVVDNMDNGDNN